MCPIYTHVATPNVCIAFYVFHAYMQGILPVFVSMHYSGFGLQSHFVNVINCKEIRYSAALFVIQVSYHDYKNY